MLDLANKVSLGQSRYTVLFRYKLASCDQLQTYNLPRAIFIFNFRRAVLQVVGKSQEHVCDDIYNRISVAKIIRKSKDLGFSLVL